MSQLDKEIVLKQTFINLRFTHKKTPVTVLDAITLKNPRKAALEIRKRASLSECVLLQTCNRTEFFAVTENDPEVTKRAMIEYWLHETGVPKQEFQNHIEESMDAEALRHLFRMATGLESMLIGEDQILGQIRDTFNESKNWGVVGPFLEKALNKAIRAGGRIRAKTGINKGAVSLGSAAVKMTERILSGLEGKELMIIGAGETGTLVGKALAARRHSAIYVANRTFNSAVRLAKILGGTTVHYDEIDEVLPKVDVVFVATSAPHMTLKRDQVARAMTRKRKSKKLLIFDLSQPRNVESRVSSLKGVRLLDIDVLQNIASENMKARLKEMENAECQVDEELKNLQTDLKRRRLDPFISDICSRAEDIREREFRKACRYLRDIDESQRLVVEKLTRVIVDRILHNPLSNLRKASENGDAELPRVACILFSKAEGGEN